MPKTIENKHENPPEMVEKLVTENMPLAHFIANKHPRRFYCGDSIEDRENALSWAMEGLLRAAKEWDETKGIPFGSYAAQRIRWTVKRGNGDGTTRLAVSRGAKTRHLHLDSEIGEDGATFADIIPDKKNEEPDAPQCIGHQHAVLNVLATFNNYEQDILKRRFGFDCEAETLEQIAESYGITRERIRQIEEKLLLLAKKRVLIAAPAPDLVIAPDLAPKQSGIDPLKAGPNDCCEKSVNKFGFTSNGVQRYRCKKCGALWIKPNRKIGGNHTIPDEKRDKIIELAKQGKACRVIANIVQVNKWTVMRYRNKIPKPEMPVALLQSNQDTRNRTDYLKKYYRDNGHIQQAKRQRWRDILRAYIQRILAESPRPMLSEEVHRIVVKDFPDVKTCAVGYILTSNCEDTFEQVGSYWTYKLPEFFMFHEGWPKDVLIARAAYCERYGIVDNLKIQYEALKREKETHKAITNAGPIFGMLNATAALKDIYENGSTRKSTKQ